MLGDLICVMRPRRSAPVEGWESEGPGSVCTETAVRSGCHQLDGLQLAQSAITDHMDLLAWNKTGTQLNVSAVKLLICVQLLAERVGFVPDEPAALNGLGAIATARIRQIH